MPSFPFGTTVTFLRRTPSGHDRDNKPIYTMTPILVPGCAVWPTRSSESTQGQEQAITGITVFAPDGTVVLPTDQAQIGGITWEVVGEPGMYASPLTGTRPGVEIQLQRVEG